MDLLLGLSVIMLALIAVCGPIVWWLSRDEAVRFVPATTDTVDIDTTVVLEPVIVDVRHVDNPDEVHDVLGAWKPWEHTPSEPVLLGHVLTERQWDTFSTDELRVLAA